MDDAGLPALQEAIRHMHGCESTFVGSVPVTEKFQDEIVWEGEVQVFDVTGHPQAKRVYAWSYATEGTRRKFVAVLGIGPVIDATTAVRVFIASPRG